MSELLRYWAFKLCGKGEQEDAASDVMTAAADEIERLRKALCWYARGDFDYVRRCSSWDGGATARAALEVKP
jgi:hypothetical protein